MTVSLGTILQRAGLARATPDAPPASKAPPGRASSEATLVAAGGAGDGAGKGGRPVISNGAPMSPFTALIERHKRLQAAGDAALPVMVRQPIASRPAAPALDEVSTRRTPAAQAAYDRKQRANNERVAAEAAAMTRRYMRAERESAAAASPAGQARTFAQKMMQVSAETRGETYDVSTFVPGPTQEQRVMTTEMVRAHVKAQGRRFVPGPSQAGFRGDNGDCE